MQRPSLLILIIALLVPCIGLADMESCEFSLDRNYRDQHPIECALYDVVSFPVMSTMMSSSAGTAGKQAYINEVRDEAALYVGSNGTGVAGAALRETIGDIRARGSKAEGMTDLQISRIILSKLNQQD